MESSRHTRLIFVGSRKITLELKSLGQFRRLSLELSAHLPYGESDPLLTPRLFALAKALNARATDEERRIWGQRRVHGRRH